MVATTELTRVVCPCNQCQENRRVDRMVDALDELEQTAGAAGARVALLGTLTLQDQDRLRAAWETYQRNLNWVPPVFASKKSEAGAQAASLVAFPPLTISSGAERTASEVIARSEEAYWKKWRDAEAVWLEPIVDKIFAELMEIKPLPPAPTVLSGLSSQPSRPYLTVTQPSKSATRGAILFSRFTKELGAAMQGLQLLINSPGGPDLVNMTVNQSMLCGLELTQVAMKWSPSKQFFELYARMDGGKISLKISTYSHPWTPEHLVEHPHFHKITVTPPSYRNPDTPHGRWVSSVFGHLLAGESKVFYRTSESASPTAIAEAESHSSTLTWPAQSYEAWSGAATSPSNARSST